MSFHDLNIRARSVRDKDRQLLLTRAFDLGFSTITWSINHFGQLSQSSHVDIKSLAALNVDFIQRPNGGQLRSFAYFHKSSIDANMKQLSRITITVDDTTHAQVITSGNEILRNFDIVAVCPGTSQVLSFLCKNADVDIITLDFTHKLNFQLNKKLLDIAVKRGVYFEILYSPLLTSPATRRQILSNCRILIKYLHGKHIILSSGAETMEQLRGPMDVVNMGELLGLTREQARKAISESCLSVLRHALSRRLQFLPLEILSSDAFVARWPGLLLAEAKAGPTDTFNEEMLPVTASVDIEETDAEAEDTTGRDLRATTAVTECETTGSKRPRQAEDQNDEIDESVGDITDDHSPMPTNESVRDFFSEEFIALEEVAEVGAAGEKESVSRDSFQSWTVSSASSRLNIVSKSKKTKILRKKKRK